MTVGMFATNPLKTIFFILDIEKSYNEIYNYLLVIFLDFILWGPFLTDVYGSLKFTTRDGRRLRS